MVFNTGVRGHRLEGNVNWGESPCRTRNHCLACRRRTCAGAAGEGTRRTGGGQSSTWTGRGLTEASAWDLRPGSPQLECQRGERSCPLGSRCPAEHPAVPRWAGRGLVRLTVCQYCEDSLLVRLPGLRWGDRQACRLPSPGGQRTGPDLRASIAVWPLGLRLLREPPVVLQVWPEKRQVEFVRNSVWLSTNNRCG